MSADRPDLSPLIDHALLDPHHGLEALRSCCDEATHYGFSGVCVASRWVGAARERLGPHNKVSVVAVVGFRQAIIPFDRPARFSGETNYNRFLGSLRIGFNGVFCFSTYALTLSTWLGFAVSGFSFLLMAVYLFYKLMGWTIVWGNPTLVILISFLGGIQLISVGILGEYIARIYEEVKERPRFIIDRAVGFEPASNAGEQRTGTDA